MLHIADPDVLCKLAQVEGRRWCHERKPMQVEALQAAWLAWQADPALRGTRFEPEALIDGLSNVIYGASGYHRYQVQGSGEIVLLGSSATAEGIARARAANIRVTGGPHQV